MRTYLGYGFCAEDITDRELVDFIGTLEEEEWNFTEYVFGEPERIGDLDEPCRKEAEEALSEYFFDNHLFEGEFIARAINDCEKKAGTMKNEELLAVIDNYVFITPVTFVDQYPETVKRVPSKEAFQQIIKQYFPTSKIMFGEVFEGNDDGDNATPEMSLVYDDGNETEDK